MNASMPKRPRRLIGTVVSDKMQKTAVVEISHLRRHARYLKYYRVSRRLKAHTEKNEYRVGDRVLIEETRPLSKEKRWRIIGKTEERAASPSTAPAPNIETLNPIP